MKGIFDLTTADGMFRKLSVEFERFKTDSNDTYQAFNFFVTAEHIPDWLDEKYLRKQEPLLRICSHIANGAKHFVVNRHSAVIVTEKVKYAEDGYFAEDYVEEPLIIQLSESEAQAIGKKSIRALDLAELIVDYWSLKFPDISID
jgi:hypothetical protein